MIDLIYIDRNWMQWYFDSTGALTTANFPPAAIHDLEVTDEQAFRTFLQAFVSQYHVIPSQVVIILSDDAYLWLDLPKDKTKAQGAIDAFIESIPFDQFITKELPMSAGTRLLAVPTSIYQIMRSFLEASGFQLLSVLPTFVLGVSSGKRWMDQDMAKHVIKNLEALKTFTLVTQEETKRKETANRELFLAKNKRAMVLGVVFAGLLLILLFLVIRGI